MTDVQQTAGRAIDPSLSDTRVIVTGGGSTLGAGLVEAFVAQGCRPAFVDMADDASLALVDRLSAGALHLPFYRRCDLIDLASLKEIVAAQCLDARIQSVDVTALVPFLASDGARMCTGYEYFVGGSR